MKRILFSVILFTAFFCQNLASAQQMVVRSVSLATVYVPTGFDNINRAQVMVEGTFPDSCYRAGNTKVEMSSGDTIKITQEANYYQGACTDAIVPYNHVVELGILKEGNYNLVDGASGRVLGKLPIAKAPQKSPATYPDDYLYAPLSDASVIVDGAQKRIVLSGGFTDDCTKITEVKIQTYGQIIQVLPITERATSGCTKGYHPFQYSKPLNVADGHYFLHARSLSGNSISKMVDVYNF